MKRMKVMIVLILGVIFFGQINVRKACADFKEHVIDDHFVGAFDLFAVDLDQDGDVDILAAGQDNKQIAWYENDGSGHFSKHTIDDQFSGAWCVWAGDVDGDGRIDVLGAAGALNEIAWWKNMSGSFSKHTIDNNLYSAESVCSADFSGDGHVDLAAVGTWDTTAAVCWYENKGDNTFRKHIIDPTLKWAHDIFPVDIDQDGRMDIVVAAATEESFVWYRNRGDGSFEKNVFGRNYYGAYSVYAADINGDGYPDVQGAVHSKNEVVWWENDGGHLITHVIDTNLEDAISVYAGDANNDGYVDILATGKSSNTVALYVNDGSEHFTKVIVSNTFGGARSPIVGDFNGDGKTDIAAAALYDNKISWWENTSAAPAASITVDSPNGGENWLIGSIQTISWHSSGSIANVNIEYSTDNGNSWQRIVTGYTNSGNFTWTVPNNPSDNCRVRVIDSGNSSIYDHSDHSFRIYGLEISGYVYYDGTNRPIPNTNVTMTGTSEKHRTTDVDGRFSFFPLAENSDYAISVRKDSLQDVKTGVIDAYDAALAARYAVGLEDLDAFQKMAADVDGDGQVLMYDAANIARFSVGLSVPSNMSIGKWIFVPSDTVLSLGTSNISNIVFKGIVQGDVSQNWEYTSQTFLKGTGRLPNYVDSRANGDTVVLNFRTSGEEFLSLDLDLSYNPDVYKLLNVRNVSEHHSLRIIANREKGRVRLACFSPNFIKGNTDLLDISFVRKQTKSNSEISLKRFALNGVPLGQMSLAVQKADFRPRGFKLSKNYPNPFKKATQCSFDLPKPGRVTVVVYNLLGARVVKLANRYYQPGNYTVRWDGRDSMGRFLPSGVYILAVKYGNQIKENRVLFVK